jgi:hypothetical protein
MKSVKEQKKESVASEIIDLPSGAKATKIPFKGKHVMEAQRVADGDVSKGIFAIIVVATLIDGKRITIEDLYEMDGKDVIHLMAEYNDVF